MAFCKECGKELGDEKFCAGCGTPVPETGGTPESAPPAETTPQKSVPDQPEPSPPAPHSGTRGGKRRKLKWALIAVGCAVVVAAIVVIAVFASGSSSQPAKQVQAFYTAVKNNDASTGWNMLSATYQKDMGSESAMAAYWANHANNTYTVGTATVNGNSGTVQVTRRVGGKSYQMTVAVIKENGVWKIQGVYHSRNTP